MSVRPAEAKTLEQMQFQLLQEKLERRRRKEAYLTSMTMDVLSLEEALRSVTLDDPADKNAIVLLHEYSARWGGEIKFEVIASRMKAINEPEFTTRASYSGRNIPTVCANGAARSKHESKKEAANNLIERINAVVQQHARIAKPQSNRSSRSESPEFVTPPSSPVSSSRYLLKGSTPSSLSSGPSTPSSSNSSGFLSTPTTPTRVVASPLNSSGCLSTPTQIVSSPRLHALIQKQSNYSSNYTAVSRLQEFLQNIRLPLPTYEEKGDAGPPHMRTFSVSCSAAGFTYVAQASTKKAARHLAAQGVIDKITVAVQ